MPALKREAPLHLNRHRTCKKNTTRCWSFFARARWIRAILAASVPLRTAPSGILLVALPGVPSLVVFKFLRDHKTIDLQFYTENYPKWDLRLPHPSGSRTYYVVIRPFLAVPPIWIWIFDSPPIWGVKFVEKLGFPNIFGSEKKTY